MKVKTPFVKLLAKRTGFFLSLFLGLVTLVFFPRLATADVFLKGNYVEVGIHNAGSFGTSAYQPSGYHGNIGNRLGFVADYGKDGWGIGDPRYSGDFFLPGSPEEGWMVEWTSPTGTEKPFRNFGRMRGFGVPKTSLTNTSSGSTQSAIWEGTATSGSEKLRIIQTVNFDVNDLYFVINVVMTNMGSETLRSLEYMRNVDPDQEQPWGHSYTTYNWVDSQPPRPASGSRRALAARPAGNTNRALTIAEGLGHGLSLGLGTIDSRAVVAAGQGFSNRDTDSILNNPYQPFETAKNEADLAIVLVYELGDLAPGQSVTVDYAYILNKDDLEVAMGYLAAVTILQPTGTISGGDVIFQATTDDVPNTTRIQFFVNGASVGIDTTPDAGGVFETTFDSRSLPNGPVSLKAKVTFSSGRIVEKSSTVTIDNAGPPISFITPSPRQVFSGSGIPIEVTATDSSHPPVRISFFRETSSMGSLFLGEDTAALFTSSFGVTDLPEGETVVIKAVGTDSLGRSTTIQVSGTVAVNNPPVANAGPDQNNVSTSSGCEATATLKGSGSSDPDGDALTYNWIGPFGSVSGVNPSITLQLGSHTITLTVSDGNLNDSDNVTVTVEDQTAPSIVAPAPVTVEQTSPAGTPAALGSPSVSDTCDANPTVTNNAPAGGVFPPGTTTVTWTAKDASGNFAAAEQIVTVVDMTPPVITINGANSVTVEGGSVYSDAGASASDIVDGDVTGSISTVSTVDTSTPGSYTVTYDVSDAAGNAAVQVVRTVRVVDTTPPDVSVALDNSVPYYTTQTVQLNVTVEDICDVEPFVTVKLSNNGGMPVEISSGSLDLAQLAGQNVITVTATDTSGNVGTASITFEVILKLTGSELIIKPEALRINPGVFTAFVVFPAPYDALTVSDATADGAPHERINYDTSEYKAIIKFRRADITILPVDTHFDVTGHFTYNGETCMFTGSDDIKKVLEDEAPPEDSGGSSKKGKGKGK